MFDPFFFWVPHFETNPTLDHLEPMDSQKIADFTTISSCFHGVVMGQVLAPEVYHCLDPTKYLYIEDIYIYIHTLYTCYMAIYIYIFMHAHIQTYMLYGPIASFICTYAYYR